MEKNTSKNGVKEKKAKIDITKKEPIDKIKKIANDVKVPNVTKETKKQSKKKAKEIEEEIVSPELNLEEMVETEQLPQLDVFEEIGQESAQQDVAPQIETEEEKVEDFDDDFDFSDFFDDEGI